MPMGTGKSGAHTGCGLDVQEPIQLPASAAREPDESAASPARAKTKYAVCQLTVVNVDAQRDITK
jgi:hypothetical protein